MYRHEITNGETLDVLESVFYIYNGCSIAENYSDVIELAVKEYKNPKAVNMKRIILCMSKKMLRGEFPVPIIKIWKDEGRALIIKDVFCPNDYCLNEWKKFPEILDYIETRLVDADPVRIWEAPKSKNIIVDEGTRNAILDVKDRLGLGTVDEALTVILNRTKAMRFLALLLRMVEGEATVNELREAFDGFGSFYYAFAYQKDDNYVKVAHEFFPYIYSPEVLKVVA